MIAGVVVGGVLGLSLIGGVIFMLWRVRKKRRENNDDDIPEMTGMAYDFDRQ